MLLQYSPAIWPSVIAAVVAAAVAFFVWRRRPAPGATTFVFLAAALSLWSVGRVFQIAAVELSAKVLAWNLHFLGVVLVPTTWFVFALQYTGKRSWLAGGRIPLLGIEPLLALLLCWTNDRHHLLFGAPRLGLRGSVTILEMDLEGGFWIHAAYSYALIVLGLIILLWPLLRAPRLYRRQIIALTVGCVVAAVADLVALTGHNPFRGVDAVAWSFTLAGLMTAWGLFRFRLLDIVPVARDTLIEELADPVIVLDHLGRIVDLNPAAASILRRGASESIGQPIEVAMADQPLLLKCCRDPELRRAEITLGAGTGTSEDEDGRHYDLRITPLFQRSGAPTGRLIVLRDISERKRAEERLLHNAFHDSLTDLPNRELFLDRLAFALKRAERRPDFHFAVLFLDLDRFKLINDSLGHVVGDELLVTVAQRLKSCVRQVDTVARLGGDEFVILLEDTQGVDGAREVARRIKNQLGRRVVIQGREVFTSASIGIVLSSGRYRGCNAEDVIRDADIALYRAKEMGRSCYALFDSEMHQRAMKALQMELDLRRAVEREEFELHYQPIVSIESGELFGFEALIRWRHPDQGLLPPGEFMPFAEETNLILAIDRWVMKKACAQLAAWTPELSNGSPVTVSVNLSSRQFGDPTLAEFVRRLVRDAGVDPAHLVLEITETVILKDLAAASETLAQLKSLGIQLHLDDFGTGYSSLGVLHRLPIDKLKIDRSFVRDVTTEEGLEIVKTIVSLGKNLSKGVIAEGVENTEELDRLRAMGCDYAQGYIFAKPLPGDEAGSFLAGRVELIHSQSPRGEGPA